MQVRRIAGLGRSGGSLDYVTAWILKAGEYVIGRTRIAFVSTNSTTQGEQVGQLWPIVFERCGLEIAFAHRTFAWGSDARGQANVHVVILGLDRRENDKGEKRLFDYPDLRGDPEETRHKSLSPYLFDASSLGDPHLTVREESKPVNGLPRLLSGSQPIDDGNYIFDETERISFLNEEPYAMKFLRPYIGAKEYIQGGMRWILALQFATPADLNAMPKVVERMRAVKAFRAQSNRRSTRALADFPASYNVETLPVEPFLVIPEVSSERREYLPIGWLEPPTIPSNKIRILPNAKLWHFALLTSAMHMTWVRYIGGRLESRYQYGIGVIYNTFPLPPPDSSLLHLDSLAQTVLDARADHLADATLADLYDPDLMPFNLRKAHQALDRAVDRLYRPGGFGSDRERLDHLLSIWPR